MKRDVIIGLLSILALAGCTKRGDLPFESNSLSEDMISLAVANSQGDLTGHSTGSRGTVVETQEAMKSVGMYCAHTTYDDWSTTTVFNKMSNSRFSFSNNSWVWNTSENGGSSQPQWGHWAMTEKYTFFAYSPYSTTVGGNRLTTALVDAQPELSFTVTPTVADQEDLLAARPRKNIHPQSGGKVMMTFDHALTKVSFSVKGVDSRKIKSVTIKDVNNQGTLKFTDDASYFAWSAQGGTEDYTVATTADGGNGAIADVLPQLDSQTLMTTESGYLFMIPQSVAGKTIELELTKADGTNPKSEPIILPDGAEWPQGKYINYVFNLDKSEVELEYDILDWDDEDLDQRPVGTYLNISSNSLGSFDNKDLTFYYSTDHEPESQVKASYVKSDDENVKGSLSKKQENGASCFVFPAEKLSMGEYIVTISAGAHLTRKLRVTVAK